MMDRPILFSGSMVRALLADTKTQTRRPVKITHRTPGLAACLQPPVGDPRPRVAAELCPHGQPGDRIWAKETFFAWGRWETRFSAKKGRDEWHFVDLTLECGHKYRYAADGDQAANRRRDRGGVTPGWWKRPAIFMPRAASRITLELTDVRVEQLQGISKADAIAEGIEKTLDGFWSLYGQETVDGTFSPYASYRALWGSIHGPGSWDLNPWVWTLSFRRLP